MNRINNYLLTHYPLLWNLRIHLVWPAIILLHFLFFLAGICSVSVPESLTWYSLRPPSGAVSMAFLSGLLITIAWLVFYFRNNAFKEFYPIKRGRLMAEFLLITATILGLGTFIASYAGGVYSQMRRLTAGTDLRREADIVNLAYHFIAFSRHDFSSSGDCRYQVRTGNDRTTAPARFVTDTFSYLHYCQEKVGLTDDVGARSIWASDTIAKRWLYEGRKDSVQQLLTEFLAICRKYGAGHRFDPERMASLPFSQPGFPVTDVISRQRVIEPYVDEDGREHVNEPAEVYIEEGKVEVALRTINEARNGWLDGTGLLLFIYGALGLGLLLFSFRLTQLRTWFIAVVGACVWMVLFGVLGAGIRNESMLMILFLLLTMSFLCVAIYLIPGKGRKRIAGIPFLWALWSFPAFLPMLAACIEYFNRPVYEFEGNADTVVPATGAFETARRLPPESPVYNWINSHWEIINGVNILLIILLVAFLFIPLARKWQAMPEE